MRKTNKWAPEWMIRRAIAHLHPAPLSPAGAVGGTIQSSREVVASEAAESRNISTFMVGLSLSFSLLQC